MKRFTLLVITLLLFACQNSSQYELPMDVVGHRGARFNQEYEVLIQNLKESLPNDDPKDAKALFSIAEFRIYQYIFGFDSREILFTEALEYFEKAKELDSTSARFFNLSGKLNFLKWNWSEAGNDFESSIKLDPSNLDTRHWYSLWLMAMRRTDEAMAQSDTIMAHDVSGDYLIGRGSLVYFQHDFEELKRLMLQVIETDSISPWAYDWLGMAYNGLKSHDLSIKTYLKAFQLSDGTVEVGGGLGHALGDAGEVVLAKKLADIYQKASTENYLPPVQRAFIHISLQENEIALDLLEQAYEEHSWFIIFIQIEPWYDPIRDQPRFIRLIEKMNFPNN